MNRKALGGIIIVTFLLFSEIILLRVFHVSPQNKISVSNIPEIPKVYRTTMLAFGDVNLGRWLGQRILKGEIDYPFARIQLKKEAADLVFVNLESPISDQKGETGDPKNNLVFTGPPQGIQTLKNAGINIVSTANNHALDYHEGALFETIDRLMKDSIKFIGSGKDKEKLYYPLIIEKNNIKFAIFAVTSFMNFTPKNWRNVVAYADTNKLLPKIKEIRQQVDVVIMSYHGGIEYAEKPAGAVKSFSRWCIDNGIDVFIGHHPHVSYGIEKVKNKIIIHSLGNFVFLQPHHYWAQRSYGVKLVFEKRDSAVTIGIEKILPLEVSFQTRILADKKELQKLFTRTQNLSNIDLSSVWEKRE